MGAALRDANKGQQNARQQMLVQGLPRGARRRLREVSTLRAAGRVFDVLRQELAAARRHGVSIQVQREGQFAMDALRPCAEASERRGTAGKGQRMAERHAQLELAEGETDAISCDSWRSRGDAAGTAAHRPERSSSAGTGPCAPANAGARPSARRPLPPS